MYIIMCQTFLNIDSLQHFKFQAEPCLLTSQKNCVLVSSQNSVLQLWKHLLQKTEVLVSPHNKRHLNYPLEKINLIYITISIYGN